MPKFIYQAINSVGENVSGSIEAESEDVAKFILLSRELIPSKLKEQRRDEGSGFLSNFLRGKIKTVDLVMFTKQFHSMLVAGIPILRILAILEEQTENLQLREAISKIIRDINQGSSLSDAMQKFPQIFDRLYCDMIRAGELSGNVPIVLERLIYIIEHEAKIKADIKSALRYPLIVLIALVSAFIVLLTFVIPKFASVFRRSGLELPLPTKISMMLNAFILKYWVILLVIIAAVFSVCAIILKPVTAGLSEIPFFWRCRFWGRFLRKRRCPVSQVSLPFCRPAAFPSCSP